MKQSKKPAASELISASNGRLYRELPGGRLGEVFDPAVHATRQIEGISDRHTVTGVRLTDSADPDAPAVVVTLTADEARPVVAAVVAVLRKRQAATAR